jgi:3-hydroxyisobutyrate dehydrogenase-like beta-hydroxyacid dehydrogenase
MYPPRKVASIVALLTVGSIAAGCGVEHVPTSDPLPAPLILDPPETAWFDLRLMRKDIALALNAAQPLGMGLPVTGCAGGVLGVAESLGSGHRDIASLAEVVEQMAP